MKNVSTDQKDFEKSAHADTTFKLFKNVYNTNSNGLIFSEIIINTLITVVFFFREGKLFSDFTAKSPRTNADSAPKQNLFDTFFFIFNGAFKAFMP